MKSFTKFTAMALVLVAFLASMSFAVTSPYGRYGLRYIDPGEDHPWGGDQVINDPVPLPQPGPTMTTSTVIVTGYSWIDTFVYRLFYHKVRYTPGLPQKRPTVTPVTPNTSVPSTTSTGSGSSN